MIASGLPVMLLDAWSKLALADLSLVLAALVLMRLAARLGMWPYAIAALPGTAAHEAAHYLMALVLGARPEFPSLLPRRDGRAWRLGSVQFRAGLLRSVPIVLAPLLLFPLAVAWAVLLLAPAEGGGQWLHAWVVATLLAAGWPSGADWRIAAPALALVVSAAAGWWFLR